jgi:hypothetical protein
MYSFISTTAVAKVAENVNNSFILLKFVACLSKTSFYCCVNGHSSISSHLRGAVV